MNTESICLSSTPMPYLTDCDLKQFGAYEYHCSRYCSHFVLIFMLGSHLKFTEDSFLTTLCAGEWYLQKKDVWQSAPLPSPHAEYYWIHFQAEYTQDPLNRIRIPLRGHFQTALFLPMLQKLHALSSHVPPNPFELQGEFCRLLSLLCTHEKAYSSLTTGILDYMNEHYAEPITARDLSARFHYSPEYINRRLKTEIGLTAHACLTGLRIQKASRMLAYSEKPVLEIAHECGFSDPSLFYKAFRTRHGQSPSQYRREHLVPLR